MQLEKDKISSAELIALATTFYVGTAFVTTPGTGAGNNAWLAVLLGFLEGLLFLSVLFAIVKKYPDKTLIQINDIVFGPLLGKLISILYLLFFLNVTTLAMRIFAEYFAISMTQTPLAVFLASFILVPALAVRNGIEVIGRTSLIIFPIIIFAAILDTLLLIPEMNLSNLLPFMDIPLKDLALAAHETNSISIGESLVFLMILVSLNKPREAPSSILKTVLLAGTVLVIVTIRNISVLGELLPIVTYPSLSAIRLINIGEIFTRLEIMINITLLAIGFIKFNIFYYSTVVGTAQLLKMRTYIPLVLPVGAMIVSISLIQYDTYMSEIFDTFYSFPLYSLVFELFLPLLTLLIITIKRPEPAIKNSETVESGGH